MYAAREYKHVDYLWDEEKAGSLEGDEIALLLYRSNILGADLRITNYGGGNTSCKATAQDPLSGRDVEVMWVKGSGGLQLERCVEENPGITGIMLGGHGVFTWGDTAFECYLNSLDVIERASEFLEKGVKENGQVFGGRKIGPLAAGRRREQAAKLAPVLRGLCSSEERMIGHFTDEERVLEFIGSNDLQRLASMGTSCPDHFLRTKIRPLVLDIAPDADLSDAGAVRSRVEDAFRAYRESYRAYYEQHRHPDSPPMRDPNPVVMLWPGVGMFTFAGNKQTARVAAEFYINAINVMRGAEAVSGYVALPPQEAFDIEYWLLEEAKLRRLPPEQALSRKIALITGGAGGIGNAIARKLAAEGACVVLADLKKEDLQSADRSFSRDQSAIVVCDVTDEKAVEKAFQEACLAFGGIDMVVNCAGLAISKPIEETTEGDWDLLHDVIVKGQFMVSKAGAIVMKKQGLGGDIVNVASKNALVAGPNNIGYGTAKAAQVHMSRLMAAELAEASIRVNVINPDAVIVGSKIWEGAWAEKRAAVYGVSVEELPDYYAQRTLLKEIILPEDIANGVFALVGGLLSKSTGNVINVDGGIAAAFVR